MHTARLDGYQREIAEIDAAVREGTAHRLDARSAGFRDLPRPVGPIHADMSDLLDRIQGNLGNYLAVKALPEVLLVPWFFVSRGADLLAAGAALALGPGAWLRLRWVLAALGVGPHPRAGRLPDVRARPQGRPHDDRVQDDRDPQEGRDDPGLLRSIAVGQGRCASTSLPALRRSGLTADEVATRYPGSRGSTTTGPDPQRPDADDRHDERQRGQLPGVQGPAAVPAVPVVLRRSRPHRQSRSRSPAGPRTARAPRSSPKPESAT